MSECDKMVRASCNFGSVETEDSQDSMLDSVMLPSFDLGEERFREDMSRDILERMRFSFSIGFIEGVLGLEAKDPMIYSCKLRISVVVISRLIDSVRLPEEPYYRISLVVSAANGIA
jgi:hypothetical protein